MKWTVSYYSEKLSKKILALPKKLLGRYLRMIDIIQECGPNLGMPHTRSMGDGLFELRIKSAEGIARAFYCTIVGNEVVILHCYIKKTQKAPKKELDIAYKRLKEVIND